MYTLDLEKAEEPEIKLLTSVGSQIKAREFQKNICFNDYDKAFDSVDHKKLENPSRDGNTRPLYLPPEKPVLVVGGGGGGGKKQQLEPDMVRTRTVRTRQLTSSKLEKEYDKAVYCHSASLP